ncbi:hypothetical protein QLQ12_39340 [Actinoplanes sp. NEAU-A12]|uniref:Uncharacterized protein n=1 Tax=Actinoplanes sandaracinus TaxID=3045177 RepID=A0ABT6WY52_9ACTN|nr:hypothetical protein [Actinoplanes sandaracinus]MDI6104664.1 hypothetical protein [Actinoplanes sandaracinus]
MPVAAAEQARMVRIGAVPVGSISPAQSPLGRGLPGVRCRPADPTVSEVNTNNGRSNVNSVDG